MTGISGELTGLTVVGDQGSLDRCADEPVVPDAGVERGQPLDDAGPQPGGARPPWRSRPGWFLRDRLGKWLTWLEQVKSVEDQRGFLRSLGEAIGHGNAYRYLVRVKGQLAGLLALKILLSGHTGEIGYWLGRDYEGRGIATRGGGFLRRAGRYRPAARSGVLRCCAGSTLSC